MDQDGQYGREKEGESSIEDTFDDSERMGSLSCHCDADGFSVSLPPPTVPQKKSMDGI
jgi:hypothetical protein